MPKLLSQRVGRFFCPKSFIEKPKQDLVSFSKQSFSTYLSPFFSFLQDTTGANHFSEVIGIIREFNFDAKLFSPRTPSFRKCQETTSRTVGSKCINIRFTKNHLTTLSPTSVLEQCEHNNEPQSNRYARYCLLLPYAILHHRQLPTLLLVLLAAQCGSYLELFKCSGSSQIQAYASHTFKTTSHPLI